MDAKIITIADVAKLAGVSPGTVSRVMNGRDGDIKISGKTKEKVLQAAAALGYRPNPFASALRSKKTGIIGAVVRDVNEPFLRKMIRDVQTECHRHGLEILFGHAAYELSTAERQMNMMMQHLFDGVFLIGNLPGDEKLMREIGEKHVPAVSITGSPGGGIARIDYDDLHGAGLAMKKLYALGHRRIAFLGNVLHAGVSNRLAAYGKFVKKHGLPCPDEYVQQAVRDRGEATMRANALMRLPEPPTAMFCASDLIALGAVGGVWQLGLQVPRDVSIMGYDDIDEAGETYPSLTTVSQPTVPAARKALELLSALIAAPPDSDAQAQEVVIKPELIVRASCAEPAARA